MRTQDILSNGSGSIRFFGALAICVDLGRTFKRGMGNSKSDIVRDRLAAMPPARQAHPLVDILAEIDRQPVRGPRRNAARDKKRLPEIIPAHYRAAKRHYRQ